MGCRLIKVVDYTLYIFRIAVTGHGVEEERSKETCGVAPVLRQNRQTRFRKRASISEAACRHRMYTQSLIVYGATESGRSKGRSSYHQD